MLIIRRYLRTAILTNTAVAVVVLLGLFSFFTFVEALDQGDGALGFALKKTALTLPTILYEVTPMCTLIGTLTALGAFAQSRELIALRAAGLSTRRLLSLVLVNAALVLALGMAMGELVAPAGLARVAAMDDALAESQRKSTGGKPRWVHDGNRFVRIGGALDARRLRDVSIWRFNDDGELIEALAAARAEFARGEWTLFDVQRTALGEDSAQAESLERLPWQFSLGPAVVSMVAITPERLTLTSLARVIFEMQGIGQSAASYLQAFWRRLAYPFAGMAMVLLAIPGALAPRPRGSAGRAVLIGVGVGIGFYLANQTCNHIGTVYGLPPLAAALLPTATIMLAAAVVNLKDRPPRAANASPPAAAAPS